MSDMIISELTFHNRHLAEGLLERRDRVSACGTQLLREGAHEKLMSLPRASLRGS